MAHSHLLRRLARNAGWLLGGKAANAMLSLAVLAVSARALGPEGLGRLVMLQGFVQLVAEIAKFQSWQGVVRFGALDRDCPDDMARLIGFSAMLDGLSAILGLAATVLAGPLAARQLGWPPEIVPLIPLYGTAIIFLVPGTATGLLRLHGRFDLLAAQSAAANATRLIGAVAAWGLGGGLAAFALVWWLAALVAALMPVLCLRPFPRLAWPHGIRARHPEIMRFFLLTSANSIIALAPGHLATLIVGTMLGPAAAGLFRVAKQFADAASKPSEFLAQALYPEAARMSAAGNLSGLDAILRRLILVSLGLAALALAVLAGAGEAILRVAVGPDFTGAAMVMAVLAVASGLAMAAAPIEPVLIAQGRAGIVVGIKAGIAAFHVMLLVGLLHALGLVGAGVAASMAAAATFLALLKAR